MTVMFHAIRVVAAGALQELRRSWRAMLLAHFVFQLAEFAFSPLW